MGLLYQFPVSEDETDYYQETNQEITIKSYGLPHIFWFYYLGIMIVMTLLAVAIWKPLIKLFSYPDILSQFLAISLLILIVFLPIVLLSFFFYEKVLIKKDNNLIMKYKIFGFSFKTRILNLTDGKVELNHFLDSPNMARIKGDNQMRGFQNKGYFEIFYISANQKVLVDRSSRKIDLEKLKTLLKL